MTGRSRGKKKETAPAPLPKQASSEPTSSEQATFSSAPSASSSQRSRKAEPAATSGSSRRTRAHPSPGGFKELPASTRSRHTGKTRKEAEADNDASEPASLAQAPAQQSEDDMAQAPDNTIAHSTTSRSQTPQRQSESPVPQAPESRSTSPPNDRDEISPPNDRDDREFINRLIKNALPSILDSAQSQQSGPRRFGVADKLREKASRKRHREVEKEHDQDRPAKRVRAQLEMSTNFSSSDSDSGSDVRPQAANNMFSVRRPNRHRQTGPIYRAQESTNPYSKSSTSSPPPKQSRIVLTVAEISQKQIITRDDIIDAMLTLTEWTDSDPTHVAPSKEIFRNMLNDYHRDRLTNARHLERVAEAGSATNQHQEFIKSRHFVHDLIDNEEADLRDGEDIQHAHSVVRTENQVPQTPTAVAKPQTMWTGLSAVKNLIATPLNYFRRRESDTNAANSKPVPGEFTFSRSHNIPSVSEFTTPVRPARRQAAQTERGSRLQTPHARQAQTERRRRIVTAQKPPMHLRHLTSPAVMAEIERKRERGRRTFAQAQREVAAMYDDEVDHHQTQRKKQRMAQREEDEDESEDMDDHVFAMLKIHLQAGEKRKHSSAPRQPEPCFNTVIAPSEGSSSALRQPEPCFNTFIAPSGGSSSDDDDEDEMEDDQMQQDDLPLTETQRQPRRATAEDIAEFHRSFQQRDPNDPWSRRRRAIPNPYTVEKTVQNWIDRYPDKMRKPNTTEANNKVAATPSKNDQQEDFSASGPDAQTHSQQTFTGSDLASGSPKTIVNGDDGTSKASSTPGSSTPGPLASKKWDQTPPPKPQPRNAELPQQQAAKDQAAEDPTKLQTLQEQTMRANVLKHAPLKPSRLRQVTQMSPLQQANEDKENTKEGQTEVEKVETQIDNTSAFLNAMLAIRSEEINFDPEVLEAVMAIDDQIAPMELPAHLYANWPPLTEAEKAVDAIFQ